MAAQNKVKKKVGSLDVTFASGHQTLSVPAAVEEFLNKWHFERFKLFATLQLSDLDLGLKSISQFLKGLFSCYQGKFDRCSHWVIPRALIGRRPQQS